MSTTLIQQIAKALQMNADAQQAVIEAQQHCVEAQQQLALVLNALAAKQGFEVQWVDKHAIAPLLQCEVRTLERWRKLWTERIHYRRSGKEYLYNMTLCLHWRENRDNPRAHQQEIERWVLSQQETRK